MAKLQCPCRRREASTEDYYNIRERLSPARRDVKVTLIIRTRYLAALLPYRVQHTLYHAAATAITQDLILSITVYCVEQPTMPQIIEQAFSSQPDLHRQISKTLQTYPNLLPLFSSISTYIQDLKSQNPSSYPINTSQPPLKKRKLSFSNPSSAADEKADSISDLSFSIPQRKKLRLDLSRSSPTGALKAINNSTLDPEFGIPYSAIATAICVPVPEKAQPQYNFCILPAENSGHEQILFTVPSTKPKEGAAAVEGGLREDESYKDLVTRLLNARLPHGQLVLEPDPKEFSSSQAAPGEKMKAMHVKAFRGNKEGSFTRLFFFFFFLCPYFLPSPLCFPPPLKQTHPYSKLIKNLPRLPLLSPPRHPLRLQKTPPLPPFRRHHLHLLHLRSPTHLQPRRHHPTPQKRKRRRGRRRRRD